MDSRLFLIGGPPRAGKSVLARRLLASDAVPFLSSDVIMMAHHRMLPSLGVDPMQSSEERGQRLWPYLQSMAVSLLESSVPYCLEGDCLLPAHAAQLVSRFGQRVRPVFLGYAGMDPLAKLEQVRAHAGGQNDWLSHEDDRYIGAILRSGVSFSVWLRDRCAEERVPYIDVGADFERGIDAALAALRA